MHEFDYGLNLASKWLNLEMRFYGQLETPSGRLPTKDRHPISPFLLDNEATNMMQLQPIPAQH